MNHEASRPSRDELGSNFLSEVRLHLRTSLEVIRHCFDQLDDEQIWRRPNGDMNSIGNLLLHLTGNLRQRILSLLGDEPDVRDRDAEFTQRTPTPKDELLRKFAEIVEQVQTHLTTFDASRLLEPRRLLLTSGAIECTVQAVVLRTLVHLAGHTQEILHLTRWQLGDRYVFMSPEGVPACMKTER